ncbi:putative nucleic acid-binding, OB-fold protein [Vibrio phage 501E54-1]|nr:putative nucleic acid-binding, OB-fold protein [Vibrio phage 501E54-1]
MEKFENHQELFKISVSTGKMQVWKGWTMKDKVICSYGQLGGKMQTSEYTAEPKNIGRSNETTAVQQAILELEAMYESQVTNKHYRVNQEQAVEFANSNREPRKILDYKKGWKKMSPTLYTSTKFNGSRACVLEGQLYSKIGKPEDIKVDHLRAVVEELGELAHFDAEVYAHGLSLQRIRSAWLKPVKTDKEIIKIAKDRAKGKKDTVKFVSPEQAIEYIGYNPNDDAPRLKFYIFDIPDTEGKPYEQRLEDMRTLESVVSSRKLDIYFNFEYPVLTHSHEERMEKLEEIVKLKYEGFVHYEPQGVYEFGKRSTNAQKSKPRYDAEARVVKVTEAKNGTGTLHVVASDALDNAEFKCVMKVDRRDGKSYDKSYESMLELVGKWITFSYEELSDKGIPTKPVGELERECDNEGNPLN